MQFNGKVTKGTIGSIKSDSTESSKFVFNGPVVLVDSLIGDISDMEFNQGIVEVKTKDGRYEKKS